MNGRKWAVWTALVVIGTTASASAETVAVKASTLDRVRPALTHYDLSPSGTVSVLAQLAAFAHEHPGTKQGDEAAFLHAAVAADLLFVADFTADAALAEGVAQTFGVAKEALRAQLRAALQQHAQGVYEQPAQLALAGLDVPEHPRLTRDHDTRSDAQLLGWALRGSSAQPLAARLAALGEDPCPAVASLPLPAADSCTAPYAGLDAHSRRALVLYFALSAAEQRLAQAAKLGDPLAVALADSIAPLRAELSALALPLLPRLTAETAPLAALPVTDRWPQLDGVFVVTSERIGYQPVPALSVNTLQPGAALPAFPAQEAVATLHDLPSYVRPIDELVAFARSMRERAPNWSPAVSVPLMVPAHVLSRVLVSLSKAGAKEPLLIGRTAAGDFVSAQLHVLVDGIDPPAARSDAKLRVRLGGYTLTVPGQVTDIPRVQDPTGYHFDLPRLYGLLSKSSAKHAAVSFQSDVSAVQLTLAVLALPSTGRPIEFVVQ